MGRWNVVDPAADYYPEVTPYAYVLNDPHLVIQMKMERFQDLLELLLV
ncbi:hypothetical protein MUB18_15720 [Sphingobacterium sp. PCS056]|nr:hypothetical protein MUB18_15720 [Sphingobacterium sp. PCS056]